MRVIVKQLANENWQGKPKYSEKTCLSATLSTTNPTWPDPGLNLGLRGGKPATNRLSYGTAWVLNIVFSNWRTAFCDTLCKRQIIRWRQCVGWWVEIYPECHTVQNLDTKSDKYFCAHHHPAAVWRNSHSLLSVSCWPTHHYKVCR
jgi:hypothetical protein